jgi:RNA polymerase sigma-70 factor (ECF subfamily)
MRISTVGIEEVQRPTPLPVEPTRPARFLASTTPVLDHAYRLAGLLLGNATEAEDAVQDALVAAWQGFDRLRDVERFPAWFDRILVNGCRDRLRRRGTVRFVQIDASIDPAARDPFRTLIERDALLAGIGQLTPDERIVVVFRFWDDLPLDEIADRLGWPLGTVKSRLHRAISRLRDGLAVDDKEVRR